MESTLDGDGSHPELRDLRLQTNGNSDHIRLEESTLTSDSPVRCRTIFSRLDWHGEVHASTDGRDAEGVPIEQSLRIRCPRRVRSESHWPIL